MVNGTDIEAVASYLPQESFSIYLRYKQSTRAIVKWLLKHGDHKASRSSALTIRDLSQIACKMRKRPVVMPDVVNFHFRNAIGSRRQLSRIFRSQNASVLAAESTDSHEFFTHKSVSTSMSFLPDLTGLQII